MKFQIEGASRETGDEIAMTVDAVSAEEACEKASRMGILVAEYHAPLGASAAIKGHATRLASQSVLHARRLLKTRHGRIGAAVAAAVVIMLGVVLFIAHREDEKMRLADEEAMAAIDRLNGNNTAVIDKRIGDAAYQRALARVRAAAVDTSTESSALHEQPLRRKTKSEAIESNPAIMAFLDDYPDLRSLIERGGTSLTIRLQLLVSAGKLRPSDVRYICNFSDDIQTLPSY